MSTRPKWLSTGNRLASRVAALEAHTAGQDQAWAAWRASQAGGQSGTWPGRRSLRLAESLDPHVVEEMPKAGARPAGYLAAVRDS